MEGKRGTGPCATATVILGAEVIVTFAPADAKKLVAASGVARVLCIVCCSAVA